MGQHSAEVGCSLHDHLAHPTSHLPCLSPQADFAQTCPAWSLHWQYRKRNLLRELLAYRADILCLQEVQSDHYLEFWAPELSKAGYMAIYKKKTTELYTDNKYAIDGCATFFKRDRFALVKKYEVSARPVLGRVCVRGLGAATCEDSISASTVIATPASAVPSQQHTAAVLYGTLQAVLSLVILQQVEFNKAALSLAESFSNPNQKKSALNRLLKVGAVNSTF